MYKECKMQDLSHLSDLMPQLVVQLIGGLDKNLSSKYASYRKEYIRLIDKAIGDYAEGRKAIVSQINEGKRTPEDMAKTGRKLYTVCFTNHMEDCLNAIRRLFYLLDRLIGEMSGDQSTRILRKSLLKYQKEVVNLRDTIEHAAERIRKGELGEGKPVMLMINNSENGVCVGNVSIDFATVEKILMGLHDFGTKIISDVYEDTE